MIRWLVLLALPLLSGCRERTHELGQAFAERGLVSVAEARQTNVESAVIVRGTVTEKVTQSLPGTAFATSVLEEALTGTQTMRFEPDEGGRGTFVELELDYELTQAGRLGRLTDFLFIRRAQSDALQRTLRRFSIEAADQASL